MAIKEEKLLWLEPSACGRFFVKGAGVSRVQMEFAQERTARRTDGGSRTEATFNRHC